MPRVAYGAGAYRRDAGNIAELRLINMHLEATPPEEGGAVLLSRKGLSQNAVRGAGPVTGVFRQAGVFGGDTFAVSGGSLFRGATDLGAVAGSGPVSFAGRAGELLVTAGGTLYSYNGTNLAAVALPDSFSCTAIEFHDGLFLAARAGSHRYYWSAVNDGRTWDALDFASAESKPDSLRDLKVVNDTLWLFGEETLEPWANTGNADAPYQRFEQRIFDKGAIATGCTVRIDNGLMFVGHDGMAYRLAEVPQRVSDHGIEERIAGSATVSAFGYVSEGHSFFTLRLAAGTFAYDLSTQQWCELASYGRANFRGRCATEPGKSPLFGDDETGAIWELDGWEDGGDPLERLFGAAFPIKGGAVSIDNLMIEANVGWTELLAGQGSDPVAEMRGSNDAGATFSAWEAADLGEQGEFRTKTEWRALGMFDWPGALFEFRVTDPVGLRISGVHVNEPGGGRSR